jgi:membrane protein
MAEFPAKAASGWTIWQVVKESFNEFLEDKCTRLGAALAYYTIFSIAPLLLIAVGVMGWVMHSKGQPASQNPLVQQVTNLVGGEGGKAIGNMVDAMSKDRKPGIISTIVGFAVLLFGAAGVFGQLQDALNTIWHVAPKPGRGIWGFIRDRFLSFAMVGGICFLLLVSLVVSAALSAVHHFLGNAVPGLHYLWVALDIVISLGVITLLFALMYKVLPDVKMAWRDLWVGSFVTALLFIVGKWAIGLYLGKVSVGSTYGAVGSAVVLLLWVYYSSQIFLLGAEFTKVYAMHVGSRYVPDSNAVLLTDEVRAHQGIPRAEVLARKLGQPAPPAPPRDEYVEAGNVALLQKHRDARRAAKAEEQKPLGRLLPATLGFAAGFAAGKMAAPKPKRLVLAPGVRIVRKPTVESRRQAQKGLWRQFRQGWKTGVKKAD